MRKLFFCVLFMCLSLSAFSALYHVSMDGVSFSGQYFDGFSGEVDLSDDPLEAVPQLKNWYLQKIEDFPPSFQTVPNSAGQTYQTFIAETPHLTQCFRYLYALENGSTTLDQMATSAGIPVTNGDIEIATPSGWVAFLKTNNANTFTVHINWHNTQHELSTSGQDVEWVVRLNKVNPIPADALNQGPAGEA